MSSTTKPFGAKYIVFDFPNTSASATPRRMPWRQERGQSDARVSNVSVELRVGRSVTENNVNDFYT